MKAVSTYRHFAGGWGRRADAQPLNEIMGAVALDPQQPYMGRAKAGETPADAPETPGFGLVCQVATGPRPPIS